MEKMLDNVMKFLEQDNINMSKYFANSEIMKNETREIYQATARLYNQKDISSNATATIDWAANVFNRPLGLPRWFMAAYPDVVKWFSDLKDEEMISVLGNLSRNDMDENNYFKLEILRKIVDDFKRKNKLECI
jgi:hypothetical protein